MAKRRNLDSEYIEMLNDMELALAGAIPGLVWFFEGPYGPSPCPDQLRQVRDTLAKLMRFKERRLFD